MATETYAIKYEEEHILNSRGLKLFTCRWLPANRSPKALIFMCHGYAMECSITMNSTGIRLSQAGFAMFGIDYEGHGKSEGVPGLVMDFDSVIDDCFQHFSTISEKAEYKNKMRILMGESMGGAVALLLHRKEPQFWDGAILVAPMCKIAEEMKPNTMVIKVLNALSKVAPSWRIVPGPDIIDIAFKVPEVREEIRKNEYCYKGKPRLRTASELLRISREIEGRLHEVSLPFLILHGEEDQVTDKAISKQLHEVAESSDKTLKLYPGMWHGLLYGEPPENLNIVFSDIIGWIEKRSQFGNTRLERELKGEHEHEHEHLVRSDL
ncbi:caffeoylshikimate esterase-like [Vigna umbellata]|uniref:caffeoylshikimate esterase-like n=1 Tax=Vigna umbellata TaxID=87088 RepID=UPI001F5FDFEA|nr:caffeoylshikimate esterase-like [Vigna umbellata]